MDIDQFLRNLKEKYFNFIEWCSKGATLNFIPFRLLGFGFSLFVIFMVFFIVLSEFISFGFYIGNIIFAVLLFSIVGIFLTVAIPTFIKIMNNAIEYDKMIHGHETKIMKHNLKWSKYHSKRAGKKEKKN